MKKKILLFFLVLSSFWLFSQKTKMYPKIDSIKILMSKKTEISLKGHQLLCNYYDLVHHKDSAYKAINKYILLSKLQKNETHFVKGLSIKGIHFGKLSKLDSAMYYFKKVANYPTAKFKIKQEAINNTAIIYRMAKKIDSALIYMKKGLELAKKEKYNSGISNTYIGLSNIYGQRGNYNNRLTYLDSALFIANNSKDINYRKSANLLHTLGNINFELNNLKKAKEYYLQALDTCNFYKDNFILFYINNSIASLYIKENKLDSALIHLNNNIKHSSFDKNKDILVKTYRRFFELEYNQGNYKKALLYNNISLKNVVPKSRNIMIVHYNRSKVLTSLNKYTEALEYLSLIKEKEIKDLELKKNYYKTKFDIYLALNKKNEAKGNLIQFLNYNDSLFSKEKSLISSSLEIKYKTQEKETQILALENQAQKKEITLQKSKTKTNYAIASIFLIILGGGLYFRKRKKDQKLKILEESIKSSEQEKIRIGKELHDGIASNLRLLAHDFETKDIEASHKLLDSYTEIRNLSHQLNNTPIHGEIFMDRLYEIVPKNKDNQLFEVQIQPPYLELQEPFNTHFFRISQELFTNNLKYAKASKTKIEVTLKDEILSFNYSDNGIGSSDLEKGNGLKSIEGRVTLLKGTLVVNSNNGFTVSIEIPYKN